MTAGLQPGASSDGAAGRPVVVDYRRYLGIAPVDAATRAPDLCCGDDRRGRVWATVRYLAWDSVHFAMPIGAVSDLERSPTGDAPPWAGLATGLAAIADERHLRLLTARLDAGEPGLCDGFRAAGFKAVDELIVYRLDLARGGFPDPGSDPALPPDSREFDAFLKDAVPAMGHGRFFADPGFPRERAESLYRQASIAKRAGGAHVAAVRRNGRLVGVAIGECDPGIGRRLGRRFGYLWLLLVAPDMRGQGVGRAVFDLFCATFRHSCDILEIGTQAGNTAARKIYVAAGADQVATLVTFHRWNDAAGAGRSLVVARPKSAVIDEYETAATETAPHLSAKWGSAASQTYRFSLVEKAVRWNAVSRWLDIGCSRGGLFAHIEAAGHDVGLRVGVDIAAGQLPRRWPGPAAPVFLAADFETAPIVGGPFDLVTLIGVLQQCGVPPRRVFRRLRELVSDRGQVFLTTKNLLARLREPEEWAQPPHHSWYHPDDICSWLEEAGFAVAECRGFHAHTGQIVAIDGAPSFYVTATASGAGRS